jgi:hypothetical protein
MRNLQPTTDLWEDNGPAVGSNGSAFEEEMLSQRVVEIIETHAAKHAAKKAVKKAAKQAVAHSANEHASAESSADSSAESSAESSAVMAPLFIYYAMHLLHSPLCVPADTLARFAHIDNEDRRYVSAMTSLVDEAVSKVVAALHTNGLWAR